MTGKIFGNNGILLTSSQEYKEQIVNELIRLTSVASVPVISSILTTPPNSGLTPDSYYIVPVGATGAWAGKTNQIAYPLIGVNGQPNGDWGFWLPFVGVKVSLASGSDLFFTGTGWQNPAAGGMLVADYGGSSFGIVAKADEITGNPSDDTFYGKESGNKGFFGFFSKVRSTTLSGLSTTTGGAITSSDTTLVALGKLQNSISNILGTLLTGLSTTTGGTITNTDNIIQALGKLQNQINNIATNVLASTLTGLSTATGGTITNTDNIIQAFGKLQNQINNILGTVLTGLSTTTGGAITNTDTTIQAFGKIQNQINNILGTLLTGLSTTTGGTITSSDTALVAFGKLQNQIINISSTQERAWPIAVFSLTANDPRLEGASFPKTLTLPPFSKAVTINKVSGLINSLSSGSAVISIQNGSTAISGLSNLNCTTTVLADQSATANNVINAGGRLIISFSSITNMINLSFRIDYMENL